MGLVFWDGSVTVCCADINGELCVGDITKESFEEIWRNSRLDHIRKMLIEKDYSRISICDQCDLTNMSLFHANQQARQKIYKMYD